MILGDFSSVVQLGVGLHAGTALLQAVTEMASTPISRRISRLKRIAEIRAKRDEKFEEHLDRLLDLLGDLEIKKIQFFNEYRKAVSVNTGFAIVLCCLLAATAFFYSEKIPILVGFLIVLLSFGPASLSLALLWSRWGTQTETLKASVDALDACMLGNQRSASPKIQAGSS